MTGAAANGRAAEPLLRVRDLRIVAGTASGERTIASAVDLDLVRGETLGIVGESGSGKSMTARAIVGLLPSGVRASGEIRYGGRDVLGLRGRELQRLRGAEIGLLFQDPFTMLNPLMRCGEHIVELLRGADGARLGRRERRAEAVRRLAEVGIDDPAVADAYPFQLSGGMRQRVGIAAALARDPQVLIADEPSTALDVTTQKAILARLKALQAERGMALILITHDLRVAFSMCDRVEVLYAGRVLERGAAEQLERRPRHPYTLGLLLSEPPGDRRVAQLPAIGGSVPAPDDVADRCPFAPRCEWVQAECTAGPPPLVPLGDGASSACVRVHELADEIARRRALAVAPRPEQPVAPPAAAPLVAVRALSKVFGDDGEARRVPALDGVSLHVDAGESVGLVGESGSGKTTLGRCLLGLERPSGGAIEIDGVDASDYAALSARDRGRLRRTIQMVFQDPYSTLNPARTIGATLAEPVLARDARVRDVRTAVGELLERVGLPAAYAARKPIALSGGERQRVAIARALAVEPRMIVCDEAVSALDVSVQAQILNLLEEIRRDAGIACLFITHDLAVVRQVTERVYVLCKGELVEEGPTGAVLDQPSHPYTRALVASTPRTDRAWLDAPAAVPAAEA